MLLQQNVKKECFPLQFYNVQYIIYTYIIVSDEVEYMKPSEIGLIFLLTDIFGQARINRSSLHEIDLKFQNGRLRSVPRRSKELRDKLENIMVEVAVIPADFSGKVFIVMKGGSIVGYHFTGDNGDGMDAPRIYNERLSKRLREEAEARH